MENPDFSPCQPAQFSFSQFPDRKTKTTKYDLINSDRARILFPPQFNSDFPSTIRINAHLHRQQVFMKRFQLAEKQINFEAPHQIFIDLSGFGFAHALSPWQRRGGRAGRAWIKCSSRKHHSENLKKYIRSIRKQIARI